MSNTISARALVKSLMDNGFSPQEISEAMEGRVSSRTIYRWAKGESAPGNGTDYDALLDLARLLKVIDKAQTYEEEDEKLGAADEATEEAVVVEERVVRNDDEGVPVILRRRRKKEPPPEEQKESA